MRTIILLSLLFPALCWSQQDSVKKISPGLYQITQTGLAILDNYAKMYEQCSTAFDSAAVKIAELRENYFAMGEQQQKANNKINDLTIRLDQSQINISVLDAENSKLKLDNIALKSDLKKEKRKGFFTKVVAGLGITLLGILAFK